MGHLACLLRTQRFGPALPLRELWLDFGNQVNCLCFRKLGLSPLSLKPPPLLHFQRRQCRSAVRLRFDPYDGDDFIGFRVALSSA